MRTIPLTNLAFQPKANATFSQPTLDAGTFRAQGRQRGIRAEPLGLTFFNAKDPGGASFSVALVGDAPGGFMAPGWRAGPSSAVRRQGSSSQGASRMTACASTT